MVVRAHSAVNVCNNPGLCTYRQLRWFIYACVVLVVV